MRRWWRRFQWLVGQSDPDPYRSAARITLRESAPWLSPTAERDSAPPRDDSREPSKSAVFGRTPTAPNGSKGPSPK